MALMECKEGMTVTDLKQALEYVTDDTAEVHVLNNCLCVVPSNNVQVALRGLGHIVTAIEISDSIFELGTTNEA